MKMDKLQKALSQLLRYSRVVRALMGIQADSGEADDATKAYRFK